MKVAFFTEGGREIGLGHVSRCAALAEGLRRKFCEVEIRFALRGDETALEFLKMHGFSGEFFDWERDLSRSGALLSGAEGAVVDSYLAGEDFYHFAASRAERLLVFDESFRLPYPDKAFILNPTAEPDGHPRHLFGLEYIVLRPPFWESSKKEPQEKVKKLLISLGNNKISDFSFKIAQFLYAKYDFEIEIINYQFKKLTAAQIKHYIENADLAISAGGQTIFELLSVGLPVISLIIAENQVPNVEILSRFNLIWNAGWYNDDMFWNNLKKGIDYFMDFSKRKKVFEIASNLIDGKGINRILERMFA